MPLLNFSRDISELDWPTFTNVSFSLSHALAYKSAVVKQIRLQAVRGQDTANAQVML